MAMLVFCNQGDAKAEINVLLSHLKDLYADKMLKGNVVILCTILCYCVWTHLFSNFQRVTGKMISTDYGYREWIRVHRSL